MSWLIRLSLVLILVLSGAGLGAARGQLRIAGTVVLCAGEAVTVLTVDVNGRPVQRTHLCPDMALSLLAAVANPPPLPLPQAGIWLRLAAMPVPVAQPWRMAQAPRARGPPRQG